MKNSLLVLAISLLGLNLISCKNGDSKKVEELQAKLDSIALADSLMQVEQDELAKAEKNFTTPDLSLFGLHGHVSSVIDRSHSKYCCTYLTPVRLKFTEEGALVEYTYCTDFSYQELETFMFDNNGKSATCNREQKYDVKRNKEGWIKKMTPNPKFEGWPEGMSYVFHYNKSGKVDAIDYYIEEGAPLLKVTKFNDQDLPLKIIMSGYTSTEYTFDYKEFDAHGNWTICDVKLFHPAVYDGEEDEYDSFQLARDINYYPNPVE